MTVQKSGARLSFHSFCTLISPALILRVGDRRCRPPSYHVVQSPSATVTGNLCIRWHVMSALRLSALSSRFVESIRWIHSLMSPVVRNLVIESDLVSKCRLWWICSSNTMPIALSRNVMYYYCYAMDGDVIKSHKRCANQGQQYIS